MMYQPVDFYPRSPCGERQPTPSRNDKHNIFLSTLSLRRATDLQGNRHNTISISIHALLAESDPGKVRVVEPGFVFLSTLSLRRATRSEFHRDNREIISIHALLAESDARRASRQQPAGISIHALLAESDRIIDIINNIVNDFYPRSPCGERRQGEFYGQS